MSRLAWALYWLTAVIVPVGGGWFSVDQIECRFCMRDIALVAFGAFGYCVAVASCFALTRPREERTAIMQRGVLVGSFFALYLAINAYESI